MGMIERLAAHLQKRYPMSPSKVCLLCAIWTLSSILGLGAKLEYASGRVYPMAWCLGLAQSGDVKSGPFSFVKTRIIDKIIPIHRGADTTTAKGIIADCQNKNYQMKVGTLPNFTEYAHITSAPDEFTSILEELSQDFMAGYEEAMTRLKDFQPQTRQLASSMAVIPRTYYAFASVAVKDPFLELVKPRNFYKGWLARMLIGIDTSKKYVPRVATDPLLDAETDAIVTELKQWWKDYQLNDVTIETDLKLDYNVTQAVACRGEKLFKRSRKSTASAGAVLLRAEENLLILLQIYWMSEQFINSPPPCYYTSSATIDMKLFKPVCKVADIFLTDSLLVCSLIEGDDDVKRVRRILSGTRRWTARQELLHRFGYGKERLDGALAIIDGNGELDSEKKTPKRGPSGLYYRMRKVRK